MTDTDEPSRPDPRSPDPADSPADVTSPPEIPVRSGPAPRWQPDIHRGPSGERPVVRRVRGGCLALVIVLLLICCVLSAWLTDSILDLRAITTGN